jgi:hypothetical protein
LREGHVVAKSERFRSRERRIYSGASDSRKASAQRSDPMMRRALKVMAISYAVKTVLVFGLWLLAPDLVRQGRDRAVAAWASLTGDAPPAAAAVRPSAR